jgi:hypothetical protein
VKTNSIDGSNCLRCFWTIPSPACWECETLMNKCGENMMQWEHRDENAKSDNPSDIPIQNPVGTVIITSFPLVLKDSMICWPIFGNIVAYWLASTLLKVCLGGIKWMILHLSYLFVSYGITQDRVSLYGKGNPLVQSIPHWKFCPFSCYIHSSENLSSPTL